MAQYIFAYHGGKMPDSPEEGARVMGLWQEWYASMGAAVVQGGAPVSGSKTVSKSGVSDDGGPNPLSGYTVVEADTIEKAITMAQGCPILEHGSVEVAECMEM